MINVLLALLARLLPKFGFFILFQLSAWHVLVGSAVVAGVVVFLDKVFLVLGYFGALLLSWVVKLLVAVLLYVVSRLPDMPPDAPTVAWEQLSYAFGLADRYMPMSTVMLYLGMLFSIYSGIMVYKLVKLIRGGGVVVPSYCRRYAALWLSRRIRNWHRLPPEERRRASNNLATVVFYGLLVMFFSGVLRLFGVL